MQFADIHRRFVASHLAAHEGIVAPDRLTLLFGAAADPAPVVKALALLGRPGRPEIRLELARTEEGAPPEGTWPLLAPAALAVIDDSPPATRLGLQAMAADIPVLYLAGTAGEGPGLEAAGSQAAQIAAAVRLVLEEPWLRRALVRRQRAWLETLADNVIADALGPERAASTPFVEAGGWLMEGPFDSSYSLAIVNRSLALALERQGETVGLVSRDGPGPLIPDPAFLAAEPQVAAMWRRAAGLSLPDVVTRNLYPPHVLDMRGLTRVLANYAWEESGFPPDHVAAFNASLNLITVTSRFVAKVLRDNGVRVPIAVVGNGVFSPPGSMAAAPRPAGIYRFLHVSSCFPRKGVDVLLAAWGCGFTRHDGVELVIKTFPNIHNDVAGQIAALGASVPDHAPIRLIEEDIGEDRLHALYASADAVVCPTRGEGFGLPLAEALVHGKPVVTTGFGGQRDFCTPETAWLCDFSFAYSRAHLGLTASVWAEPDADSLVKAMQAVRAASPAEVAKRVDRGRALLRAHYTWDAAARRTQAAVTALDRLDSAVLRLPKIGWISTWNTRCGIATYSAALTSEFPADRLALFANRNAVLEGPDSANTHRCWTLGWAEDDLEELYAAIRAEGVEALVLQFNLSFFPFDALCRLVERVEADGIPVFLFFHSTQDVERPMGGWVRLAEGRASLGRATRIVVHTVSDLNRMKDMGLVDNVTLFPHGLPEMQDGDRAQMRREPGLDDRLVVATFGFLLPHKGLREIIRAVGLMRAEMPAIHLMMLNALYPADVSREELEACQALIRAEGLEGCVTIVSDFLAESDILSRLSAADIVVYPYQNTQESASGAVRLGLASGTPVACTPLGIFEDVAPVVRILPGISPEDLAGGLTAMLADREGLARQAAHQARWAQQIVWPVMRGRLEGLIRGTLLDRTMACNGPADAE